MLDALTCVYVPLCSLLAGCLALGEEKSLGLSAPQLTLPVSYRLLWFAKLGVSAGTAIALNLALPLILFWSTNAILHTGFTELTNPRDNGLWSLAAISAILFFLSYWSITFVSNTVRGVILALVGLAGVFASAALGAWLGDHFRGVQTGVFTALMCHFQLPPDLMVERAFDWARFPVYGLAILIIVLLLRQSLSQFRRSQQHGRALLSCSLTLGVVLCLAVFWSVDVFSSINRLPGSAPVQELRRAITVLGLNDLGQSEHKPRMVLAAQLDGRISPQTKAWVKNALITYNQAGVVVAVGPSGKLVPTYQATVLFPNGRQFSLDCGDIHNERNW